MDDHINRRRNYYIKREFQRDFIMKFCLVVLAGAFMSGAIIYCMSMSTSTTSFENLRLVIRSTADYILPAVLLSGIVVIIVTGIAAVFITLMASHKIVGPLYRIEQDIKQFASGNLAQEFNLRQGDEVKPIAEALNSMAHCLRDEVGSLKAAVAELESAAASAGAPAEVRDKIKDIKARIGRFRT